MYFSGLVNPASFESFQTFAVFNYCFPRLWFVSIVFIYCYHFLCLFFGSSFILILLFETSRSPA